LLFNKKIKAFYVEVSVISAMILCGVLPAYINQNLGEVFLCLLFFAIAAVN